MADESAHFLGLITSMFFAEGNIPMSIVFLWRCGDSRESFLSCYEIRFFEKRHVFLPLLQMGSLSSGIFAIEDWSMSIWSDGLEELRCCGKVSYLDDL